MYWFKISLPVLAFGTALAFPVWAAPQNQSTTLDDISQSNLPEGGTLSSVTGNIRVGASGGPLSIRTVSGDIHIEQSAGSLDVRTVSGTLTVDHASGATEIRSASGDVRVNHAGGAASVRTMSGKSTLPHLEKDVTIRSISGDTMLTLDPASRMRTIDIGTVSGNMTLHLPHDFGGTFDILLKQRRSEKTLPLEQSLGLTVQTGVWEKNSDSSEEIRTITATGKVGDGRDHVIVRSVVGTLTLVQD